PDVKRSFVCQLWQWRRGRITVEYSGGCGLVVLITDNKQAVMGRGLFIELNADITKATVKVGFFWDFWSAREDLSLRPPTPHDGALPGCATCRLVAANTTVFHTDCK